MFTDVLDVRTHILNKSIANSHDPLPFWYEGETTKKPLSSYGEPESKPLYEPEPILYTEMGRAEWAKTSWYKSNQEKEWSRKRKQAR
jgi:hypothetical protein